jgi:hypothetical protein
MLLFLLLLLFPILPVGTLVVFVCEETGGSTSQCSYVAFVFHPCAEAAELLFDVVVCWVLWSAEVRALPEGQNRASLLAGLQQTPCAPITRVPTGVCFELRAWTEAEFRLLCKAMEALGPAVHKVVLVDVPHEHGGAAVVPSAACTFLAAEFVLALQLCVQLEELTVAGYVCWLAPCLL